MASHLSPDHSKGDESTIGGYAAVHARPAAFESVDGMSYSVELCAAETGDPAGPWGAYLLFLRWRRVGEQGVEGHMETDFIVRGADEATVLREIGRMPLATVKATLDALGRKASGGPPTRRWWDVMNADDDADDAAPVGLATARHEHVEVGEREAVVLVVVGQERDRPRRAR